MSTTYMDRAAADAILKEFYLGPVRSQLNSETVLAYRLQKNQEVVEGRTVVIPLHTSRNVAAMSRREDGIISNGATLPSAGRQGYTDMRFPVKYNYGAIKLTGPVMASARTQRGAFAKVINEEVVGMVRDLKNDLNRQYFCDGSGRFATITTIASAPTYEVYDPWDYGRQATALKWLQVGDRVVVEDVSAASSTLISLNSVTTSTPITAVDIAAKTFTVTGSGGGVAIGDHVVKVYDDAIAVSGGAGISTLRGTVSTTPNTGSDMMGLIGLCSGAGASTSNWPRSIVGAYSAVPAGQVYCGSNSGTAIFSDVQAASHALWRSNNFFNAGAPRALTTDLMQQAFDASEQQGQAAPSIGICSYNVRRAYVNLLTADRRYVNEYVLDGGFKAIDYNGTPVVPDKDCPEGALFWLSEDNLMIARSSDFYWLDKDGAVFSRSTSRVDAFEAILAYYAELACDRRNAMSVIGDIAIS